MSEHQSTCPELRNGDPECGSTARAVSNTTAVESENADNPRALCKQAGVSPEQNRAELLAREFQT